MHFSSTFIILAFSTKCLYDKTASHFDVLYIKIRTVKDVVLCNDCQMKRKVYCYTVFYNKNYAGGDIYKNFVEDLSLVFRSKIPA